jgi:predicted metal-dependent HD superfamily phosphohydrolase
MTELENRWHTLVAGLPAPVPAKREVLADLLARYQATGRHYHNLAHLRAMFALAQQYGPQLRQPVLVALAIWFHDAVYNPLRSDNEAQSATLARRQLELLGLPNPDIDRVEQLILATKAHQAHSDPDTEYLLDFDLAILAAPLPHYQAYAQQIRQEYDLVPNLLYRPGRRKVLKSFLDRPAIFHHLGAAAEAQARANLTAELADLV